MSDRGQDEDGQIQAAILRRLLNGPSEGESLAELSAAIGRPKPTPETEERVERAVDVLRDVGLAFKQDERYRPTRAAVHYRRLSVR